MPEITRDEVAHLADLARIDLSDAELDHLAPQLAVILESVASIQGVAGDDVPPTSHALPLTNVFREDVVRARPDRRAGAVRRARGRAAALHRPADPGGRAVTDLTTQHRRRAGRRARPPARPRSVELTQAHLDRIAAVDGAVHAFLHVDADGALAQAAASDARRAAGDPASALDGVPIAVKDVLATEGLPTTCGSRILEGWVPPYDATVVARLRAAGLPILGKTNMDEFAMGSSTEHSAYGPTHNPWDLDRIPGGSGGGSAAAVAAFEAPLAHRHRHRRLDPPARRGHRHGRREADVRRGLPLRPGRAGQLPRPGRPGDPHRARRRAAARGDRRPRPARLHQHRPAACPTSSTPRGRAPTAT